MKDQNKTLPTQGDERPNAFNEWKYDVPIMDYKKMFNAEVYSCYVSNNGGLFFCKVTSLTVDDTAQFAEDICTAINNTYGKGINPEAVPVMFEALMRLAMINQGHEKAKEIIKEAIKKAEL